MASVRNRAGRSESTRDRLLAAARECVVAVGWKRTTLTDVANRAGLSRPTVYRTYPDMATLFADLMTAEWAGITASVVDSLGETTPGVERIAAGVAGSVAALRDNELFRRAVDLDPDWLLPYLLQRRGRSQDALLDILITELMAAQAEGAIRAGDPVLFSRQIILAAHGNALSVATMSDDRTPVAAFDQELAELIRRYLAP